MMRTQVSRNLAVVDIAIGELLDQIPCGSCAGGGWRAEVTSRTWVITSSPPRRTQWVSRQILPCRGRYWREHAAIPWPSQPFPGVLVKHHVRVFAFQFGGEPVDRGGLDFELLIRLAGALGERVGVEAEGFEQTGGFADAAHGSSAAAMVFRRPLRCASRRPDRQREPSFVLAEQPGGTLANSGAKSAHEFEGGVTRPLERTQDLVEMLLDLLPAAAEMLAPDIGLTAKTVGSAAGR